MASFTTNSNHRVLWMAFIDQGEFEVNKDAGRRRAPRCDKHHFCAKMKVSSLLKPFARYRCWKNWRLNEEASYEKWHFHDRTLLHLAVFRVIFGHLYQPCWSQRHSKGAEPECLNKLLACLWWSYTAFKYCVYCALAPSLHRESTDTLIRQVFCHESPLTGIYVHND